MWRVFMILCMVVFGLGAISGLVIAGFAVVEGDLKTAGMTGFFAVMMGWSTFAFRRDWQRENQRREFERGK